jgi:hypothetical protein
MVDVLAVQLDHAFDPGRRDGVVHPVERAQESGLAAARRADERRHGPVRNAAGEHLDRPVDGRLRVAGLARKASLRLAHDGFPQL